MWRRISARKRDSGSPGKVAASTTTALSALASRSTAALALSLSVQTCAAVNATKRPKMMPNGGSIPGEIALNARPSSPFARIVTSQQVPAASKNVTRIRPAPSKRLADCAASRSYWVSKLSRPGRRGGNDQGSGKEELGNQETDAHDLAIS